MTHPAKYPSTPHWPWSQEVHKDDRVHGDPDFFVGREVAITEKLDGGNTLISAGQVYARSTGQPAQQSWFQMVRKHHVWKTIGAPASLCFFGEDLYAIHSITYDEMSEDETYRVFNIRDGDRWLGLDEKLALAAEYNFLTVPLLFRGTFESTDAITKWLHDAIKQPSVLGPEREGFVIQITDSFDTADFSKCVSKFVRTGHVQSGEHWTRTWKPTSLKYL